MSSLDVAETFVFEGTKIEYVEGRFLNCQIDAVNKELLMKEFALLTECKDEDIGQDVQFNLKQAHNFQLPDSFFTNTVVGHVTCIGCANNIYIFQYITGDKQARYVKFLLGDISARAVTMFEDTHHFFHRDSAAVAPIECLLSPDRKLCLLRLPQSILSPKKWSKLLICKTASDNEPISLSNPVTGTKPSRFRDRRFQLAAFDPKKPSSLVILMFDDYCSKCKISVYDFEQSKEVIQCNRKIPVEVSSENSASDSDSEEDELVYFFLKDCSLTCNKSGNVYIVTCLLQDNIGKSFCKVLFFEADTLKLAHKVSMEIFPLKATEVLVPVVSACDSYVLFCLTEKTQCQVLFRLRLPKPINLKDLCRSVIIRNVKPASKFAVQRLPIPNSLIQYLQFHHDGISSGLEK